MNYLFTEAIKLKDGIPRNFEYHQKRAEKTVFKHFGTSIDLSVIYDMIPGNAATGVYKCRVVYTDKIEEVQFIHYASRKIKKAAVIVDDSIEYSFKYDNRTHLNGLLEKSGCDDIIIIKNGLVTDAFSSNLVFESDKGLYTPGSCLLPGTKRQYLLDRKIIAEKRIRMEDIGSYRRIFFINAMTELEDNLCINCSELVWDKING